MPSRARVAAVVFALAVFAAARLARTSPTPPAAAPGKCDDAGTAAWKAVESLGGIIPEIEDDGTQAPPAWWHYPDPRRAAELLAAEARDPKGLYARVAPGDLKPGDLVVRVAGAGACGRMAVLAGKLEERWMLQDAREADGATRSSDDAFFADGKTLRPEAAAYRINVKSDSSLGHVRELERDLAPLERTIAERPPLLARDGRAVVEARVHDLLDEAWSLEVDPDFGLEHLVLGGRALALAAGLDWPGAAESAAAVLDDAQLRAPDRADVLAARAAVHLLAGRADHAVLAAEKAAALPQAPARARYVLGRALLADGKTKEGLEELRRYLAAVPGDPRAGRLVASGGRTPRLEPAPPADPALRYVATAAHAGVTSAPWGFHVEWPIPWRVVGQSVTPENGVLVDLVTERVLLDDGESLRGGVVLLAQRPSGAAARAALVKKAGRNVFPKAQLKTLPPLVPGSRREGFRERGEDDRAMHAGEVTTIEHGGVVYFLVLNAPARAAPKLAGEYAAFVKSLTFGAP
jgi:tetratricopeptide (TPR) repeat protein